MENKDNRQKPMSSLQYQDEGEHVHEMFDQDIFSQEQEEEVSGSEEEQDSLLQKALGDALKVHPTAQIQQGRVVYQRDENRDDEGLYLVYSECIEFSICNDIIISDHNENREIPVQPSKGKSPGRNKRNAIRDKWAIFNYCPIAKRKQASTPAVSKKRKTMWDEIKPQRLSKEIYDEISSGSTIDVTKINPNCVYNAKRVFGNMFMMHRDAFSAKSQNFDELSERGRPSKAKLDPIKPFIDLFKIGALYKGDVNKCLSHLDREMLYNPSGYIFNNLLNYKGTALRCKLDYWLTPEMLEYSKRINDSVNAKQCIYGTEGKDVELDEASEVYDMYK